jgi:hypothetical protein
VRSPPSVRELHPPMTGSRCCCSASRPLSP